MDLPQQAIEPPPAAIATADEARSELREDGTLVIDILIDPPCGAASRREIVVCAPGREVQRYETPDAPQREQPKAEVQISESAKVGVHANSGRYGAVEALLTLTVKF